MDSNQNICTSNEANNKRLHSRLLQDIDDKPLEI